MNDRISIIVILSNLDRINFCSCWTEVGNRPIQKIDLRKMICAKSKIAENRRRCYTSRVDGR